jgi:hypothetical protein
MGSQGETLGLVHGLLVACIVLLIIILVKMPAKASPFANLQPLSYLSENSQPMLSRNPDDGRLNYNRTDGGYGGLVQNKVSGYESPAFWDVPVNMEQANMVISESHNVPVEAPSGFANKPYLSAFGSLPLDKLASGVY